MYFEQFYLGCLAHASYLLVPTDEAAVVDPQRDVEIYIDAAKKQGLQIRYIFETHLHADFVSGHNELADRTGANIYIGKAAQADVSSRRLERWLRSARRARRASLRWRLPATRRRACASSSPTRRNPTSLMLSSPATPFLLVTSDGLTCRSPTLRNNSPECCTTRCTRS